MRKEVTSKGFVALKGKHHVTLLIIVHWIFVYWCFVFTFDETISININKQERIQKFSISGCQGIGLDTFFWAKIEDIFHSKLKMPFQITYKML